MARRTSSCQDRLGQPDFHVPRTNSGIADFPGGDLLVSLGAFEDEHKLPIGTQFMQGATLMHELGHNFELTHAGLQSLNPLVPREPNCKFNYHSVMNYLYQLRGLPDSNGIVRMDYSAEVLDGRDETSLFDNFLTPLGTPRYRSGWYAPWETSYLKSVAMPASKHCDGSDLLRDVNGNLLEVPMVRVDAASVGTVIDWNADGSQNPSAFLQDINFDGIFAPLNQGSNDWVNLRLNQLGSRRNVGGYYIDLLGRRAVGPLSLDVGRGDIGRGDIGRGDIGRGDIGRGDIGRGDIGVAIGRGDIGRGDIGRGDIGRGDIGRGDIGRGDIGRGVFGGGDLDVGGLNEPIGELTLETATAVSGNAPSPANALGACLTVGGECVVEGGNVPVRLNWQAPHLGQAVSYSIYRFEVVDPEAIFPPATLPTLALDTVFGEGAPPTTYLDSTAPSGRNLAYFVIAHFADESSSGISNFARVTTPAVAPPVTITSVVPATAADGTGQMITLFTAGAPAGTPTALFTQGETTVPGFVFDVGFGSPSHQNEYFVRLPRDTGGNPLLGAGPATVRLVFDQNTFSGDVALTVATTPGTPQARFVLGLGPLAENGCAPLLSTTPITAIAPGQNVAISAYGIDTTGARAVFTQGDNSLDAGVSSCSITDSAYGIAAVFTVPSGLGPGAVTVQVTATVNGVQSALSSPLTLTVVDAPLRCLSRQSIRR